MYPERAPLRQTALLGAVTAGAAWFLAVTAWRSASAVESADPAGALVALAAASAAICAAWLTLAAALHCLARLPGHLGSVAGRVAAAVTPALVSRLLMITVSTAGAAVTVPTTAAATVATVHAADAPAPDFGAPAPKVMTQEAAPSPGWTPTAPRPARQPTLEVLGSRGGSGEDPSYVVRRGDCLWDIVGRHLGDRATPAAIVEAIPSWHEANRDVLGPDPDLIHPGVTLTPPPEHD